MEVLQPGHYWKTPFVWEPGCPQPHPEAALVFEPTPEHWLLDAVASVMADSLDESDRLAVGRLGPARAAVELLALASREFEAPHGWWRLARDDKGHAVGFVLPVLFADESTRRQGHPEGTIFYMGVLPEFRGRGHCLELLAEATRVFIDARCWRIFCDTATTNHPMVNAFRRAGYSERAPWQRSVTFGRSAA
jgi:ribosomal protein S18 acetylase RimI-like enzyme